MKTQYYTATSIDGFIADENNSLDWLFRFGDGSGDTYEKFIAEVGAVVMGSTSYDWVLDHEILADPDNPKPWPYEQPTWVLSSRDLRSVGSGDIRFANGDVGKVHDWMREAAGDKNIWIVGGGDLAGQFHDRGLLDEVILGMAPVTLGGGAPVLPRRITDPPMTLVSATADGPFALLTYTVNRATP